jgi:hypothetical protein
MTASSMAICVVIGFPLLALCVGFHCRVRGTDLLQAVLRVRHPLRQLVPAPVDSICRVLTRFAGRRLSQPLGDLGGKRRFGGLHRLYLIAVCAEALSRIFVPSNATWPTLTNPACWHSWSTCVNNPPSADR